ncbi:MAG: alpha/beta hydrolase fold domain-containing protein [Myxococcales bacterium]|nr:alpha/beta hydrolase fold domain-containing protein [Myxococcales bacterium]
MRDHRPVRPDELDDLPVQLRQRAALRCTPDQLFESFARAEDWRAWLRLEVEWTSDPPFGSGSTRTARARGLVAEEVFTEWVHGERMSFYFRRSNSALLEQLAERWEVTPNEGGCTLTWRVAFRPSALGRPLAPALRRALTSGAQRGFAVLDAVARGERAAVRWQDHVDPALRSTLRRLPNLTFGPWVARGFNALTRGLRRVARAPDGVSLRIVARDHQELRVFTPRGVERTAGGVLWLHGGGRVIGHPCLVDAQSAWLARALGVVVVAPSYRLAPEHRYPAALDDCVAAWRWLLERARELGVEPTRVAVGGESAGGGLAAELCQRLRDEGGAQPRCQCLVYPMLDDRTAADESRAALEHLVWNNRSNHFGWSSYLGVAPGAPEVGAYAAAARRVELDGLPPAWLSVGDLDLFYREDLDYAERLRAAGVPVTLDVVPGGFHGYFAAGRGEPPVERARASLLGFLEEQLRS